MSNIPQVWIVGAVKGGVGKTTLTRVLIDYCAIKGVNTRLFDTEISGGGNLKRFYSHAKVLDILDSDGQMDIFDHLGHDITVIDLRAGILRETIQTLRDIGFLDQSRCRLTVFHVLGNSVASMSEVQDVTQAISGARYIAVGNRINDTKFQFPTGSLDIPKLTERATENVDALSMPFLAYRQHNVPNHPPRSDVLRGWVNHWLENIFAQFDVAGVLRD